MKSNNENIHEMQNIGDIENDSGGKSKSSSPY